MTPEDIARNLQFREGFHLIDYGRVGLPVFRLTIEGVTAAYKTLPTIHEFAMRCLSMGETREDKIAQMLGLKLEVIKASIDLLVAEGYVARQALPSDLHSFKLTEAGEARLGMEREEIPQEEMLVIDYDAIRRTPIRLAGENVVRASELKSDGAVEIRPYPAEPPVVSQLSIPEVAKVIRRQGGEDFRRNVLALKRIVRRNNVFREAVALVFVAEKGSELQIAFAIDGKLSEPHERAFAENGGPKKMGLVKLIAETSGKKKLDRLIGRNLVSNYPAPASLKDLRKEEADAAAQVRSITPAVETSSLPKRSNPAVAALAAAVERHKVAVHEMDSLPLRPLAAFEQSALLEEALAGAHNSLFITTAGIQPTIVNGYMLREIDNLSANRVTIEIETLMKQQPTARTGGYFDPFLELTRRSDRGSIQLRSGRQRDFYFLIQDSDLAVISNRPFLGEMVRRSGFQRVEGVVTRRKEFVEEIRRLAVQSEVRRGG